MVFDGENPRRVEAVCCKVEVVNGGRGARFCSVSFMSFTNHDFSFATATIRFASASSFGSSVQVREKVSFDTTFAVSTQYASGMNARISLSRSISMRRAGD